MLLSAWLISTDLPKKVSGVPSSSFVVASRVIKAESLVRKHSCSWSWPPMSMLFPSSTTKSWSPSKSWVSKLHFLRPSSLRWLVVFSCGWALWILVVVSCHLFIKLKVSTTLKLTSCAVLWSKLCFGSCFGFSKASWISLMNLVFAQWPKLVCCPLLT